MSKGAVSGADAIKAPDKKKAACSRREEAAGRKERIKGDIRGIC